MKRLKQMDLTKIKPRELRHFVRDELLRDFAIRQRAREDRRQAKRDRQEQRTQAPQQEGLFECE